MLLAADLLDDLIADVLADAVFHRLKRLAPNARFVWIMGADNLPVVDPGVGTPRRGCVARTKDGYLVVTPDNGTLTHINKWVGIAEVREIDQAVKFQRAFNIIDKASGFKADLIIRKNRPFSRTEFSRRLEIEVLGISARIATPEDVILSKLR